MADRREARTAAETAMSPRKDSLSQKAKNAAKRIGARLYGCYAWLVFVPLLLAFGALAMLARKVDRARRLAHFFARQIFRLARMPVTAIGLERLPKQTHVVLSNHASFLDAILLTALLPARPGYAFTTRQQYAAQALLWPFLKHLHTLVLKPHGDRQHVVNLGILGSALERGENLIVFPEGGFVSEPGLRAFHSGAFVAAAKAGVPIVIVGLRGTRSALRVGTWMPQRLPLTLEIGPVLVPQGTDPDAIRSLIAAARDAMSVISGEAFAAS